MTEEQLTLPLSAQEQAELTRLEGIIEKGLETFMEVGTALLKIREERLYRQWCREHGKRTFEDYCRGRWPFTANYAHRLIDAVGVCNNIQKLAHGQVSASPQSERVVRPLINLTPEQQVIVWDEACKEANGHPTGEQVKQTVTKLIPPEQRPKRKKKSKAERVAEKVGMRIAFDGSMVPKDFSDDDRRKAIAELNERRAAREAERRAKHGPLNVFKDEPPTTRSDSGTRSKVLFRQPKKRSLQSRYKDPLRRELMIPLKRHCSKDELVCAGMIFLLDLIEHDSRKDEYAQVCETLSLAMKQTATW